MSKLKLKLLKGKLNLKLKLLLLATPCPATLSTPCTSSEATKSGLAELDGRDKLWALNSAAIEFSPNISNEIFEEGFGAIFDLSL